MTQNEKQTDSMEPNASLWISGAGQLLRGVEGWLSEGRVGLGTRGGAIGDEGRGDCGKGAGELGTVGGGIEDGGWVSTAQGPCVPAPAPAALLWFPPV